MLLFIRVSIPQIAVIHGELCPAHDAVLMIGILRRTKTACMQHGADHESLILSHATDQSRMISASRWAPTDTYLIGQLTRFSMNST